jgi:hypothetical protein
MGPLFFSSFFNELNSGSHVSVGTTHGDVQVWEATICKQVCSMAGHPACVGEFLFSLLSLSIYLYCFFS